MHALAIDCNACFLHKGKLIAFGNNKDVIREDLLQVVYGKKIVLDRSGNHENIVFEVEGR